jgi:hypothetical protein
VPDRWRWLGAKGEQPARGVADRGRQRYPQPPPASIGERGTVVDRAWPAAREPSDGRPAASTRRRIGLLSDAASPRSESRAAGGVARIAARARRGLPAHLVIRTSTAHCGAKKSLDEQMQTIGRR